MECLECERLWQAYAEATSRYADLVNQQEITGRRADDRKLKELEASVLAAAARLLDARNQAHSHSETSHFRSEKPSGS